MDSLIKRLGEIREESKRQMEEDEKYIEAYNRHYKGGDGFRPMFQFPSKYFWDRSYFAISKGAELGGLAAIAYGDFQNHIPIGISILIFGLLVDIGALPIGRIFRGMEIVDKYHLQ